MKDKKFLTLVQKYSGKAKRIMRPGDLSKVIKKSIPEFVYDHDEAFKLWNPPVQCGDCFLWYDPSKNEACPICGGDEWVGSR